MFPFFCEGLQLRGAALVVRGHVVVLVDPEVGGVFGSLCDGQRLVVRAVVLLKGALVVRGGPDDGLALFGLHGEAQVELCAAALLDIRQVQEEGVDARPAVTVPPRVRLAVLFGAPVAVGLGGAACSSDGIVCAPARHLFELGDGVVVPLVELAIGVGRVRALLVPAPRRGGPSVAPPSMWCEHAAGEGAAAA